MRSASSNSVGNFLVETETGRKSRKSYLETPRSRTRFSDPQTLTRQNSRSTNSVADDDERKFEQWRRARQFVKSRSPWGWEIENPWLQFARANALQHSCGLLCRTTASFRASIAILLDILFRRTPRWMSWGFAWISVVESHCSINVRYSIILIFRK